MENQSRGFSPSLSLGSWYVRTCVSLCEWVWVGMGVGVWVCGCMRACVCMRNHHNIDQKPFMLTSYYNHFNVHRSSYITIM